jgi:hypothetical protein
MYTRDSRVEEGRALTLTYMYLELEEVFWVNVGCRQEPI